jgi:3-isopropylmalate dehydratase small subunit
MSSVSTIEGRAYPFDRQNVDTDVIITARHPTRTMSLI